MLDGMTNIKASEVLKELKKYTEDLPHYSPDEVAEALEIAIQALEQQPCEDKGEISDGYHTFNQLYHQRAILFATIVNQNKDKAWKSFKHSDGHYCFDEGGEMFIVGIDTPEGSYTYHYHKKYWDYFDCKELEYGKVWDGHTEEDVTRLLSLVQQPCEDAISREALTQKLNAWDSKAHGIPNYAWKVIREMPSVTPERPNPDVVEKMKKAIDEMTEIHSDGEFYIKNVDAKWIIGKYLYGAEMSGGEEE